jgi:hypothetical protein
MGIRQAKTLKNESFSGKLKGLIFGGQSRIEWRASCLHVEVHAYGAQHALSIAVAEEIAQEPFVLLSTKGVCNHAISLLVSEYLDPSYETSGETPTYRVRDLSVEGTGRLRYETNNATKKS